MGGIAPNNPVADWVVKQTGDHFGNYYDLVSGAAATVTRTTPKTIYDPNTGRIHDVPAGSFAVNPWSAYQAGGFGFATVIEEARTNSFLRSYIPDATALAAWTADAGLTATLGATAHGLYNLSKGAVLTADASNRAFWQQVTATAVVWELSCYVRKSDLSAVTATDMQLCAAAGTSTPVGTLLTTTFTALANGWYRATATFTGTAAAWTCGVAVKAGKAVTVDCFNVGIGAFSTSYIPTTTAAVTRNSDIVTVPTTGWSAAAGTMVSVAGVATSTDAHLIQWYKDASNRMTLQRVGANLYGTYRSGATNYQGTKAATGVGVFGTTFVDGAPTQAYANGAVGTTAGGNAVALTGMPAVAYLGGITTNAYNGPIARLTIYATALSDPQLADASMTSELLAGYKGNRMAAKLLAIGVL